MRDLLVHRAEEADIPVQLEILEAASTDGRTIQIARSGVPTGAISFPLRYVHTTSETADRRDIQAVIDLFAAVLTQDFTL